MNMRDESGTFDVSRLRSKGLTAVLSWSAILAAGGGLIGWGAMQTRLDAVERRANETAIDQRETERKIALSDTQIAVLKSQLDTIIIQLRIIDEKLDRQERQEKRPR